MNKSELEEAPEDNKLGFALGFNLVGWGYLLISAFPLILLEEQFQIEFEDGISTILCGVLGFSVDYANRKRKNTLFDTNEGPIFLWFPFWMLGIVWILVGICKMLFS